MFFSIILNLFSSSGGTTISEIFKDVTFEPNVFEKSDWYPIDQNVVTEIHTELQILPCTFPHAEYLRENYVKYPIEQKTKPTKTAQTPVKFRKICPENDSYMLKKKIEVVNSKKHGKNQKQRRRISKTKYLKKAKRREEKIQAAKAQKIETMEFESTKRLLFDTMDQYNTVAGQSLNGTPVKSTLTAHNSIAARTRNRLKSNTPEKRNR